MIVVDTSALIAILFNEPEEEIFRAIIFDAKDVRIGAPTLFEFKMVAHGKRGSMIDSRADRLLATPGVLVVDWGPVLAKHAFEAFTQFGKGHHPAKLNFGDCMSYALAKSLGAPLLYKGSDFAKTDIASAV